VISLMHQLLHRSGRIHNVRWTGGQMGARANVMFWIKRKSLASAQKQTTCCPASILPLYWHSCHWK
jgi:hypothetical protein